MAETLADLIPVTFIYDVTLGSPIESQPYGGKVAAVSRSQIPLPQRGIFLGQPGFSRQNAGAWEWVMQGDTDPLDAFVDSLTGRGSWTLPASRTTVKSMCQALYRQGFTRTQIQTQMPAVYSAISAEVRAEPPV
jgi:hypothetical protein